MYTLLECHVDLDLEGFEDTNPETGETTEIKGYLTLSLLKKVVEKFYLLRKKLRINKIPKKKKNSLLYTPFKFLPGLGFYGFGLIHMIGGLSRTATTALRQLLDAGTLSNLPSGFKTRGIRVRDEAQGYKTLVSLETWMHQEEILP